MMNTYEQFTEPRAILGKQLDPLMFVNTDIYLSKQQGIVEKEMNQDDYTLIDILSKQLNAIKEQNESKLREFQAPFAQMKLKSNDFLNFNIETPKILKSACPQDGNNEDGFKDKVYAWEIKDSSINPLSCDVQIVNSLDSFDSQELNFQFESSLQEEFDEIYNYSNEEYECYNHSQRDYNQLKQKEDGDNQFVRSTNLSEVSRETKSAPLRYNTANPKSKLALRTDVMNKNIIRAIRRECKSLYDHFLKTRGVRNSKDQKEFMQISRNFAEFMLQKMDSDWASWENFNIDNFIVYLGAFSNYWAMKKHTLGGEHKNKIEAVHGVFYKYSHVRFNEFINVPEVSTLMTLIWNVCGRHNLFDHNDSLMMNKVKYEEHINTLVTRV